MSARCRHNIERTVMLEVNLDGDVYLKTYCGPIQAVREVRRTKHTCGSTIGGGGGSLLGAAFIGNADIEKQIETRVGKKKFLITVTEVKP